MDVVEHNHPRSGRFESLAHGTEILKILVGAINEDEEDSVRLPGERVFVEVLHRPRGRESSTLKLPELHCRIFGARTWR